MKGRTEDEMGEAKAVRGRGESEGEVRRERRSGAARRNMAAEVDRLQKDF